MADSSNMYSDYMKKERQWKIVNLNEKIEDINEEIIKNHEDMAACEKEHQERGEGDLIADSSYKAAREALNDIDRDLKREKEAIEKEISVLSSMA